MNRPNNAKRTAVVCKYTVICKKITDEQNCQYLTYGIKAVCKDDKIIINDISTIYNLVHKMANLFTAKKLSMVHFAELVEDMLI